MNHLGEWVAASWVAVSLSVTPAIARPAKAPVRATCCRVAAGTPVQVELVDPVSTKIQRSGDTFALRLAQPLVVDGRILLRAGTPGLGDVIESSRPGMGGKAAKLVLSARYLKKGKLKVPLNGLQLSAAGRSNTTAASAVGLTGIVFGPLGFIGLAVKGGDVEFPAGMGATAKLASATTLPSLGRAPPSAPVAASSDTAEATVQGAIVIPQPPAGEGQVVFFRKKTLLGTGQWFRVREEGKALGKLTNGAYFIQVVDPGLHTYTATMEPEFKDRLKLKIDAGETYFVEGTLTKALLIGAADLSPSDHDAFDKASKDLKLAPPPAGDKTDDQPDNLSDTKADEQGDASGSPPR